MIFRLFTLLALPLCAEVFEIKNKANRVTYDDETGALSLTRLDSAKPFARAIFGNDDVKKVVLTESSLTLNFQTDALQLSLPTKSDFVHVQRHIHNSTPNELHFDRLGFPPLTLNVLDLKAPQLRAFGTGVLTEISKKKGRETLQAIVDPTTHTGIVSGWLTKEKASGIFFTGIERGKIVLKPRCDYGKVAVDSGATIKTDIMIIGAFRDARHGLERYAAEVSISEKNKKAQK
ncbi:hypothetical protein N9124_02160 [bacterium]|nr:hypothetical protein [Akkermansiaceae bacterium]MDB4266128.1 hypothetical protein [bacterium]MDA7649413.1 hypothetical protein [Akkermansiaceae bacterium]MDA7651116.1 hypothetical protein [Akkermansiaceae bacterium]MDA7674736.1 hypothetical protein [Akkermansiaceae bacterium]